VLRHSNPDKINYLGYDTMVAGFTSNHTYLQGKQQEIKQSENKWSNSMQVEFLETHFK